MEGERGRESSTHEKNEQVKFRYKNWRVTIMLIKLRETTTATTHLPPTAAQSVLLSLICAPFKLFSSLLERHRINDSYQFTARCVDNHLIIYVPLVCDFIWIGVGIAFQANRIIDWYSSSVQSTLNYCDRHFRRIFYLNIKVQCNMKCRDLGEHTHSHTLRIFKNFHTKNLFGCVMHLIGFFFSWNSANHSMNINYTNYIYQISNTHQIMVCDRERKRECRCTVYIVDASMECKL